MALLVLVSMSALEPSKEVTFVKKFFERIKKALRMNS
jgi:hypothetical protein